MGLPNFCYQKSIKGQLSKVKLSCEIRWFMTKLYRIKRIIARFWPNTAPKTPLILRGVLVEISLKLGLLTKWEFSTAEDGRKARKKTPLASIQTLYHSLEV